MSRAMLTGGEADRGSLGALAESRHIRTRTMHPSTARWSRRGLVGARGIPTELIVVVAGVAIRAQKGGERRCIEERGKNKGQGHE